MQLVAGRMLFDAAVRQARSLLGVLRRAIELWLQGHAFLFAAALAFVTVFSIAPVVIVAVAVVGLVPSPDSASGRVKTELENTLGFPATENRAQSAVCLRDSRRNDLPYRHRRSTLPST